MIFERDVPPQGTVRDWLEARAATSEMAIVFPETGEVLSWRELKDAAKALAEGLVGLGARSGESVAIVHPNGKDGVTALYGALYGGFRATMINLAAGPDAIGYALDHCGARYAFVHDSQAETITQVAPDDLSIVTPNMFVVRGEIQAFKPSQHALLMYTSGDNRPAKRCCSHPLQFACWGLDHGRCARTDP